MDPEVVQTESMTFWDSPSPLSSPLLDLAANMEPVNFMGGVLICFTNEAFPPNL